MSAGHIRARGKGSWELKFDADRDPATGKRKIQYRTYRGTKKEAQVELARLIAAVGNAAYVEPCTLGMALAGMSMGNGRSAYASPSGSSRSVPASSSWRSAGSGLAPSCGSPRRSGCSRGDGDVTRRSSCSGLVLWVGATLLLSTQRWFARRPLTERLRPYSPGGMAQRPPGGALDRDVP